MNTQEVNLTLQETEQLCRLYMECRLTVLEETELQYVLGKLPYSSPCINEVRMLMGLTINPESGKSAKRSSPFMSPLKRSGMGIAASLAILLMGGIFLFSHPRGDDGGDAGYYVAYVDGHRLSDEAARTQVEAEKRAADAFIKEMAELEARNQQIIDDFLNH